MLKLSEETSGDKEMMIEEVDTRVEWERETQYLAPGVASVR